MPDLSTQAWTLTAIASLVCGSLGRKKGVGTERRKTKPQTRHKQQLPAQLLSSLPLSPSSNNRVGVRRELSLLPSHNAPQTHPALHCGMLRAGPTGATLLPPSQLSHKTVLQDCGQAEAVSARQAERQREGGRGLKFGGDTQFPSPAPLSTE